MVMVMVMSLLRDGGGASHVAVRNINTADM